jgi:hypothetical protein
MGLALVPRDDDESLLPSMVVLAAAVLAKPTLAWAPAAALLALAAAGSWRRGLALSGGVGVLAVIGLLVVNGASHGQMLAAFRACAGGGGFSLGALPMKLSYVRPGELLWMGGGLALTLGRGRRALADPLCAALLTCVPVTLVALTGKGMF